MTLTSGMKRLLESGRWANFMESTAVALHINLSVITTDAKVYLTTPRNCTTYDSLYPGVDSTGVAEALRRIGSCRSEGLVECGDNVYVFPIKDGLCIVVRDCFCSGNNNHSLYERAKLAQKLLTSFQISLTEGFEYGQKAIELSALHQINQIILTLFRAEDNALENVINLLLSALIILLDAEGSWLQYKKNNQPAIVIKGDEEAVRAQLEKQNGLVVTEIVGNGNFYGKLGVLLTVESNSAKKLMPLLAQECLIIFEIENLFRLLQSQLNLVLGSVGSCVVLINRYGNISYANEAAAKLFRQKSLAMVGRPITDIQAPWTPYIKLKTNKRFCGQMDPMIQGEDTYWLNWQLCPLSDGKTIQGWLVLAEDKTGHYRWQEAARQADRLATTATLSGALAHELRNPLSAAKGLLQLMGRRCDPAKVKGYSDLVLKELERVTRMLNEFLLLGKPAELDPEPIDLVAFIEELMPLFEGETVGTEIEIKVNLNNVPLVKADPGQLTQVALNLVRNAIQAIGQKGYLYLSVNNYSNGVALEVRDSGPGLPNQVLENIFKPFFTTKERGTGLGLPIVQAIIHNHGGEINTANAPDGGAVFTVVLPALKSKNEKVDVLLVTKDNNLRYPAEQALRSAGIKVTSEGNIFEVNEMSKLIKPKIIVLDENLLQGITGGSIKELGANAKIVILGQPGEMENKDLDYITCPIHYGKFMSKIYSMLDECH